MQLLERLFFVDKGAKYNYGWFTPGNWKMDIVSHAHSQQLIVLNNLKLPKR